jgi:hypothetical protein
MNMDSLAAEVAQLRADLAEVSSASRRLEEAPS